MEKRPVEASSYGTPRRERGEAIVEFALLAPVLFVLLFALVDFGRAFDASVVTTNAAREGARYGALYANEEYLTDAQVRQLTQQRVADYLAGGFGSRPDVSYSLSNITVAWPSRAPGQPVTVNVPVQVQIWALTQSLFGWTPIFSSNPTTIQGQATIRI